MYCVTCAKQNVTITNIYSKSVILRLSELHDAIVIGAGPIGSYLACRLAQVGYDVLVLERKDSLGERICCTGIISEECISNFTINDDVIIRKVNSASLFAPSGKLLRLQRPETQAYIVDRVGFDISMCHRAHDAGVEYVFSSDAMYISIDGNIVNIAAIQNGETLNYKARTVVIATGFGSHLIKEVGLASTGDFVIGVQIEVLLTEPSEIEIYCSQKKAPGFFAWLVPTSHRKALVGLLSRRSPQLYLQKFISYLSTEGKIATTKAEPLYRGISLKPLPQTYHERVLVVGDAAGQVKTTTGGGIYYGLLCADIAANNLQSALEKDDLSMKRLANYQREWHKKLSQELKICYWARKLYQRLSDSQIDKIFDIMISKDIASELLESNDLSFDWHGKLILRLLGKQALSETIKSIGIPFRKRIIHFKS